MPGKITYKGVEYDIVDEVADSGSWDTPPTLTLELVQSPPPIPELPKNVGAIVRDKDDGLYGLVRVRAHWGMSRGATRWVQLGSGDELTEQEAITKVNSWGGFKVVFDGFDE